MGHWDARCCGRGDDRRDAWDDLEVDPCRGERQRLFTTASEDERIAAFEADDVVAAACQVNQQLVDQLLRHRRTGAFADVDRLGVGSGEGEDARTDRASCTTTSAACNRRKPGWSASSGSPGPAPTSEIMQPP